MLDWPLTISKTAIKMIVRDIILRERSPVQVSPAMPVHSYCRKTKGKALDSRSHTSTGGRLFNT